VSDDARARTVPPPDLKRLSAAVERAREHLATERAASPTPGSNGGSARGELLDALERYVDALARAGRPVPYRLRDELRLNRGISGRTGRSR